MYGTVYTMNGMTLFVVVVFLTTATDSFCTLQPQLLPLHQHRLSTLDDRGGRRICRARLRPLWSKTSEDNNNFAYSDEEISNMQAVIKSMSLEETDDARRQRLQAVLTTALELPNHDAFLNLFDRQLIQIGDECKAKAAKAAAKATPPPDDSNKDADRNDDEDLPPRREKTPEELQLWALVDMMIQSKTIVKRAKGELGSSGSFG